ncbi:MAG: hypothetical protein H7Y12_16165 [Sphingobacteriaceae bacterium]|nr:hypothetical protein [Cytophagaceae bacterium]
MNELQRTLTSVVRQLTANALLAGLLLSISAWLLASALGASPALALGAGLVGLGAGTFFRNGFRAKKPEAIRLIHQTVGEAEYSLHLLDVSQPNIAEQLQIERLNATLSAVRVPTFVFQNLRWYVLALLGSLGLNLGLPLVRQTEPRAEKSVAGAFFSKKEDPPHPPSLQSATLRIEPPGYTGLPAATTTDLNATALSGSRLTWQVQFSDSRNLSLRLTNSRGEVILFKKTGSVFEHRDRLLASGLYALQAHWQDRPGHDSLVYQSDYYRLEAQPDLAPKIEPTAKELYRFYHLNDKKQLPISAKFSDDFRVSYAFLVATLARGSGEAVKFREVKIPLGKANFKEATLSKVLDLAAFQFAPGDELYYYWAAFDNRQPEPNFTKSDTYFLVYKDTTKLDEAALATMAVNAMPEYFRSQRQIIIDTEKLIAKRGKLPAKPFNSTSNEIGFDQKVLRLRYGQFLGEEFESSAGGDGAGGEGGTLEGFVHKHDTEQEKDAPRSFAFKMIEELQKQEAEKAPAVNPAEHRHDHGEAQGPAGETDPLAALMEQYVHAHDNGEVNTYYEQSTRSLLKMALEQMWQSELHLRLYEPEKALPFENKALEYLKIVQQKARSYVKKTGFDPAPIKEAEKRLTGELKNVNEAFEQQRLYTNPRLAPLAAAVLGYLEGPPTALNSAQKYVVQRLGGLLSERGLDRGLPDWTTLASLQKWAGGKGLLVSEKQRLKTALFPLTANAERSGPAFGSERRLERAFWRGLR